MANIEVMQIGAVVLLSSLFLYSSFLKSRR